MLLLFIMISFLFALILYLVSFFISYKITNKSKLSSFESGFATCGLIHNTFSVHYFIVLLMFLIFDLELILLFGCLYSVGGVSFLCVFFFVVGGVYLEMYLGKLKWLV